MEAVFGCHHTHFKDPLSGLVIHENNAVLSLVVVTEGGPGLQMCVFLSFLELAQLNHRKAQTAGPSHFYRMFLRLICNFPINMQF